jgi:NADH-quinone oxidoreductase subunit N
VNPHVDWHALAPDIVLTGTIMVVLLVDILAPNRARWQTSRIAAVGVLGALVPVFTLAADGHNRLLFGGAYAVDNYALALKGFFLIVAYLTILLAADYIAEGDYSQNEFYFLLLTSVLGMSIMASGRDLITLFVALETLSIPTYVLAGYRKHDRRSNEAGIKYYLMGVLSSAVMLYGMSLIFGLTGSTTLAGISHWIATQHGHTPALLTVAIFLSLVGFAFKVSAVPFHFWAPDTYEGAPTPVTAFLSVASKAGGFVAMLNIVFFGFGNDGKAWWWVIALLAALSMTLGNLAALRQTNLVRMLAYSSIAQGGFLLVPFAAYGIARTNDVRTSSFEATIVYLLIYGAMNLGAFAVLIAVARRTRSAEISTYAGLFTTSPGLAVAMTIFLASLAGIPPLAGWYAKFVMFRAIIQAGSSNHWAVVLAIVAAVNSVIAFFYYAGVIREMWFKAPADGGGRAQTTLPPALGAAIGLTTAAVLAVGVYPELFARVGDLATRFVS